MNPHLLRLVSKRPVRKRDVIDDGKLGNRPAAKGQE